MQKIQVFLREDQKAALKTLSARTGVRQSDLVRRSVDLLLEGAARRKLDWRTDLRWSSQKLGPIIPTMANNGACSQKTDSRNDRLKNANRI